jgi:hypothetical protein
MHISTLVLLAALAVPAYAFGTTTSPSSGTGTPGAGPGAGSPTASPTNRTEQRSTPGMGAADRSGDSRLGDSGPTSAPPPAPGASRSQPMSA